MALCQRAWVSKGEKFRLTAIKLAQFSARSKFESRNEGLHKSRRDNLIAVVPTVRLFKRRAIRINPMKVHDSSGLLPAGQPV